MTNDHWVTEALTNDTLVVELLFRLKQSSSSDSSHAPPTTTALLPPLGWGHRQPRSKSAASTTFRKEREATTRCSPTTPLSWSAATSTSDGCDESSGRPSDRSSAGGSKATFAIDSGTTASNKKSRKRKTFAELKEEEGFLLKERVHLKRELATIRVTLKEQRDRSENLKRIKRDVHLHSESKIGVIPDQPAPGVFHQQNQVEATKVHQGQLLMPRHAMHNNLALLESSKVETNAENQERGFILPDLNMAPSEEEEQDSEILYVMS